MNVTTKKGTTLPIMDLKGKNYMQVQWRIVWFREEKPLWTIETSPVVMNETACVFSATIKDETGRVVSQAHKSENKIGFADFIEKAETGAIGRALANVGYGTAFAAELDEGSRIVDGPLATTAKKPVAPIVYGSNTRSNSPDIF